MLIILKSPKGESNHSLRTTLAMFPSLNVLTKLLFGISQKKNSGFVRFAHSILFNFQVPHICYRRTGLRCRLVDSLFILPQLFPFVKRFLKISFRKFSKRSALLIFRKVFKVPWNLVLWAVRSGSLATACICYHSWKKMSIAKIQTGILHFFILQSKMKLFFLSNCPIEEAKGFNLVTINPKIALLFFNKG